MTLLSQTSFYPYRVALERGQVKYFQLNSDLSYKVLGILLLFALSSCETVEPYKRKKINSSYFRDHSFGNDSRPKEIVRKKSSPSLEDSASSKKGTSEEENASITTKEADTGFWNIPKESFFDPSLTTTQEVDESQMLQMKTELAWINSHFSSETPLKEDELEEINEEIDKELPEDTPSDMARVEEVMEADLLKANIENSFILCSGSVYKKDWEQEFDKKWLKDNRHRFKKHKALMSALQEARSRDYVELVYPNVGDTVYDYPMIINQKVIDWIHYFRTHGRKHFVTWLKRGQEVMPIMRGALKQYGLPQDLVYLAMIESGFNPRALSSAGALGPWQFMPGTALRFGLKINDYVDERRDPYKASQSAATYLSFLYTMFGDWHLASASYNAGEGRVQKALKKLHKIKSPFVLTTLKENTSFFHLADARRIPTETRNYVPKIIAAMIIAKNPEKFGFDFAKVPSPPSYKVVQAFNPISLKSLADALEEKKEVLEKLNPELKFGITPPANLTQEGYYPLKVPERLFKKAQEVISDLPEASNLRKLAILVQKKDLLDSFAKRHGLSVDAFLSANDHLKKTSRLNSGQVIFANISLGSGRYTKLLKQRNFVDYEHYLTKGFSLRKNKRAKKYYPRKTTATRLKKRSVENY
jgi:membrane-bound lytic murein transglycosylase D